MRLFTRFRGYAILTLALVLFSVSIFLSFERMLKEQEQTVRLSEENAIWPTTQAEVELLRLLDALREYGMADPAVSRQDVTQRFEILLSRLNRLREGIVGAKIRKLPGEEKMIAGLLARAREVERSLAGLKEGDRDQALKIAADLRGFAPSLHDLTVSALHQDDELTSDQRRQLREIYVKLMLYFAGVFVGGTVLLVLLFRGIRRANRLLRDREHTEERLRESEQRFRDYASSSSDWLWETDEKGRFTYFSKGYLEKIGLSAVEILGKTHEEIALVEGDEAAWAAHRELTGSQQPFRDFKYRMRTEAGVRHIKVSGVPIFNPEGTFLGYRGTGTDLTAQVEAETEAMRARTLLSEAVESLDEGFVVFDARGRLVQCNTHFREIYADAADVLVPGATFEEITRAAAYRGVFPDAIGREDEWIRDRLEHQRDSDSPSDLRLKDGRWIQARETVLKNGWRVGTRIDITHQKRREEALRREALIWGQMSDGVIVTDLHGGITNWNPAAERMFGYTGAEVMGKTPRLLHSPDNQGLLATILEAVRREGGWTGEVNFLHKAGRAGIAETVVVPLRDDRGERIAIIWVNHDITFRKQTEAELRSAKEQAEFANQAKSQFLATMSHEIRTPMNGVLGMIGLLLDTKLDEEQRTYAETVRESGEALVTIIDDILDFSKMEAGKLELERTDFDLRQVVEAVVDLLAPRAQSKRVEICSFVAPGAPAALKGDPGRLRQILLNLAGNAVKFTEQGGISVLVSPVETTSERALVKFEIVDTGIGIPDHLQAGLFAEFTQVDPSYTRRYGGTGLGLAISKKLTELMGGDIGFSSRPGQGSTFWFTADLRRRAPSAAEAFPMPRLGSARILVAEDNPTTRDVLERQLAALGLLVTTVADATSALSTLVGAARLRQPFTYALVDQMLGNRPGEELAHAIRRDPLTSGIKLVLVTEFGARSDPRAEHQFVFDAVLTKPVRQLPLINALARLAGLPAEPRAAVKPAVEPAPAATRGRAAKPTSVDMSKARVLLVEDSQVNQMVATAMLAKSVAAIDTADNGVQAVEAVRAKHYDLILMDVAMPEMDGLEATRFIRAMPPPKGRVPIIAMTAHAMEGDKQRCFAAGMDDYVTKPIDRNKLLQTLSEWLRAEVRDGGREAQTPTAAVPFATRPPPRDGETGPAVDALRRRGGQPPVSREPAKAIHLVTPRPAVLAARPASSEVGTPKDGNAGDGSIPQPSVMAVPSEAGLAALDSATLDQLEADTNPSVAQELVKTFILETVDRLDRIFRAAHAGDLPTLEREAHSLKSSSGTFGAKALQERAKAIEAACKDGNAETALALTGNIRQLAASAAHAMVEHFQPGA